MWTFFVLLNFCLARKRKNESQGHSITNLYVNSNEFLNLTFEMSSLKFVNITLELCHIIRKCFDVNFHSNKYKMALLVCNLFANDKGSNETIVTVNWSSKIIKKTCFVEYLKNVTALQITFIKWLLKYSIDTWTNLSDLGRRRRVIFGKLLCFLDMSLVFQKCKWKSS